MWNIRCDVCGRFIKYSDLSDGRAKIYMVTPDSEYTGETWEALCRDHNDAAQRRGGE